MSQSRRTRTSRLPVQAGWALLFGALMPSVGHAQSTSWVAQLLVPPFGSSFISEWERNPEALGLSLTYLGSGPAEYRIEGVLTGGRRGEIARATSPGFDVAGGPSTEFFTGADLFDWDVRIPEAIAEDVFRSGIIPDDDYEVCIRIVAPEGIQLAESCATVLVELPEPPQLLFPLDGTDIGAIQPTFQWTPIVLREALGVEYRVRIVERYRSQNPIAAIESNLPVYEELVGEAPLLVYPIDAIPLEPGREYVWQVEVLDGFGDPLVPEGLLSPPAVFRAAASDVLPPGLDEDGSLPDAISLIPGFATLTDLGGVGFEATTDGWLLDGPAWLDLAGPWGVRGRARVEDLVLDAFAGVTTVTEGRVAIRLDDPLTVDTSLPVRVRELVYTPDEGLLGVATLQLPDGREVPLDGEVQVTAGGLFGELAGSLGSGGFDGDATQEVLRLGSDPVELLLSTVSVRLPAGSVAFEGRAELLGGRAICASLSGSVDADGVWMAAPTCVPEEVEEGGAVVVQTAAGTLSADLRAGTLAHDLTVGAAVDMSLGAGECALRMRLRLTSDTPFAVEEQRAACDAATALLDADWISLELSDLELDQLTYLPGTGFDLAASLSAQPRVPGISGLDLPWIERVTIDSAGLALPGATLSEPVGDVDLAGYRIDLTEVSIDALQLSWREWREADLADFAIGVRGTLGVSDLGGTTPSCLLAALPLEVSGRIESGRAEVTLPGGEVGVSGDCRLETEGVEVEVRLLDGPVVASAGDVGEAWLLERGVRLQSRVRLGSAFSCPADPEGFELELRPRGQVYGRLVLPEGCGVRVAGVDLEIVEGTLVFDTGLGGRATIEAEVAVARGDGPVEASGSLRFDAETGAVVDGEVELQGPITLRMPSESPLFTFTVDAAVLDAEGLLVDGRQRLVTEGDTEVVTTFDRVRLVGSAAAPVSGSVLFDGDVALTGALDEEGGVAWRAGSTRAPFTEASAVRLDLPAQTVLGAGGLGVDGRARARLRWEGRDLGGDETSALAGLFRDDFLLALDPAAVAAGAVDLSLGDDGDVVARIDASGFHPDFATFGLTALPARIPLPTEEIAWLEVRDAEGALRVEREPREGAVRIYSRPGEPIPLGLPGLDADGGEPPTVDVEVDLLLDARSLAVREGGLRVAIDAVATPELDLAASGLPLRVLELIGSTGPEGWEWVVLAEPVVLGETRPGASVRLALLSAEGPAEARLVGDVDLPWPGSIDLAGEAGRLRFEHDRLEGRFDVGIGAPVGTWRWSLDGDVAIDLDGTGGAQIGALLEVSPDGLAFVEFEAEALADPVEFSVGPVDFALEDLAIPRLERTATGEWDFELAFDLGLSVPELELTAGPLPDLRLGPDGLELPALEFPGSEGSFDLAGFTATALAIRLPSITLDPFGAGLGAIDADWRPRFDLSVSLGEAGRLRWPALGELSWSALDVSWGPDGFTGSFEPRALLTPISLDLGLSGLGLDLDAFEGSLDIPGGDQVVDLRVGGALRLPACAAASDPSVSLETTLGLRFDGAVEGRIEAAEIGCPIPLGPVEVALASADLEFLLDPAGAQEIVASGDAELRLIGEGGADVLATGVLGVAIGGSAGGARVTEGAVSVTQPFVWGLPIDDPLLELTVQSATLDMRGFVMDGGGAVRLPTGGAGPSVGFTDLTWGWDGSVESGRATIAAGLAFDAAIEGSGTRWGVGDPAGAFIPASGGGFRLAFDGAALLNSRGITTTGTGSAELIFGDTTFAALDVQFSDFEVALADATVGAGRADFAFEGTEIAYVDPTGFFPGDLFGALPLPDRIPLPSLDVAYLQVRDPVSGDPLVQTGSVGDDVSISTSTGQTVDLVLPGVDAGGGTATVIPVTFDVVANSTTYALVSGSVSATSSASDGLLDLRADGVPLVITGVRYSTATPGGPRLDGRVDLPGPLAGVDLRVVDLRVGAGGLTGEAIAGSPDATDPSSAPAVVETSLGALDLGIVGARVTLGEGPEDTALDIAGYVASQLFRPMSGTPIRIPWRGELETGGLALTVQSGAIPAGGLPIGSAVLTPTALGARSALALEISDQALNLSVSGVLGLPDLAPDFAVTLEGLTVGTDGVQLAQGSVVGSQSFELFGATFALRDGAQGPGLGVTASNNTLSLLMNGDVTIFEKTVAFRGLRVGTDGSVGMANARLADRVDLVPGSIVLEELSIEDARLRADLAIDLPAPFNGTGTQRASLAIDADGTVAGSGLVALVDEPVGLPGGPQAASVSAGDFATAHVRWLAVRLGEGVSTGGAIEATGDLYLGGDNANPIAIGVHDGGRPQPGVRIGFDGSVAWGPVSGGSWFAFEHDLFSLTVQEVGVQSATADALSLALDGRLSVSLPAVTGTLGFDGLGVGSDLSLDVDQASVQNGQLSLASLVTLSVTGFEYSSTPTTITDAPLDAAPVQGGAIASGAAESIEVASVLRFGGSLDIGCAGESCLVSGGVDEVLFYRTAGPDPATSLVVRNAGLSVPGASMNVSLRYGTSASGDIRLAAAGEGSLIETFDINVVGAFERERGTTRAGLFVAVDAPIPLIPGILTVRQLGGGFFVNPRSEHCTLVTQAARIDPAPASMFGPEDDDAPPTSPCAQDNSTDFAAFLYGAASIVGGAEASLGRADVLLTVTSEQLSINGRMAFFSPGDGPAGDAPINGYMDLMFNWAEESAQGQIGMSVDFSPLVTASNEIGFFVYRSAWGVYGNATLDVLGVLKGRADLMIGSAGFLVDGEIGVAIDLWILEITAGAKTTLWYADASWGVYLEIYAGVEIAGGVVSVDATLRGALTNAAPDLVVAAGARARGCVLSICHEAQIYAEFRGNGGFDAGFGTSPGLKAALAEAERVRGMMRAVRDQMVSDIGAAVLLEGLVLDPTELAAIYARVGEDGDLAQALVPLRSVEENFWAVAPADDYVPENVTDEQAWFDTYTDLLLQLDAPRRTPHPRIAQLAGEVQAGVALLDANRSGVERKLGLALDVTPDDFTPPDLDGSAGEGSPVDFPSYSGPPEGSSALDATTAGVGPTFEVDQPAVQTQVNALRARQAARAAYADAVDRRLQDAEATLVWLDYLLLEGGPDSPLGFARDYGELVQDVEEQYARQGDLLMRQQDWLRDGLTELRFGDAGVVEFKTLVVENAVQAGRLDFDDVDDALLDLIAARAAALDALQGSSTIASQWASNRETHEDGLGSGFDVRGLVSAAEALGNQIWRDIAQAGISAADSAATVAIDSVRTLMQTDLASRRAEHRALSGRINRAFEIRAELVGVLTDLYGEYFRTFNDRSPPAISGTLRLDLAASGNPDLLAALDAHAQVSSTVELFAAMARDSALAISQTVPSIGQVSAMSTSRGYLAEENFSWGGSHPDGIVEYAYGTTAGASAAVSTSGLRSNGAVASRKQFALAPDRQASTEPRTLRVGVRGGAGYLGVGRASYTRSFRGRNDTSTPYVGFGRRVADTTPPLKPSVRIGGLTTVRTRVDGRVVTELWTAGTDRIEGVTYTTADHQSGIAGYEYAIGTRADSTLVRDWTPLGGRREFDVYGLELESPGPAAMVQDGSSPGPAASSGGWTPGFVIRTERGYRVFVRATNGEGLTSETGMSPLIGVDDTHPIFPSGATVGVDWPLVGRLVSSPAWLVQYGAMPMCSDPGLTSTDGGASLFGGGIEGAVAAQRAAGAMDLGSISGSIASSTFTLDPSATATNDLEVTFRIPPAVDTESGVSHYAWRISADTTEWSAEGWTELPPGVDSVHVEGGPLVWGDTLFFSVVAIDRVGQASAPLHTAFEVEDRTPPIAPRFCADLGTGPGRVRGRIQSIAYDYGSDIASWDTRILDSAGRVLLDYPAQPTTTRMNASTVFQRGPIPAPPGTDVWIQLRVRNRAGLESTAVSGPVRLGGGAP